MSEGTFHNKLDNQVLRFKPLVDTTVAYLAYYNENSALTKVYFYVNPSRLSYSYRQKTTRRRTRSGWAEEYWGEELDTVTVEAVTGGFKSNSTGYREHQETSKNNDDFAFSRLESLIKAYRHGGLNHEGTFASSFAPVQLHFDKFTYYGFFENLNVEDSVDKPFMFSFNFTFKVLGTDVLF